VEDIATVPEASSVIYQYDVGQFVDCAMSLDDYTKCQLLENPWMPPHKYEFPFSVHHKKTRVERRYVGRSHLEQYHWLVLSHAKQGLFCKYCPFFVPGHLGGIQKATPLRTLVTKPLTSFAKLLGKDGDLEVHSRNKYHLEAVESGKSFLKSYHNPSQNVVNQVSAQRLKQVTENRQRLRPIVETVIFLARQNIPLRGHRDDGAILDESSKVASPVINEGNFRELLRFRIQSGDTILESHLKQSSATATYVSKTVQNELIDCCGAEVVTAILTSVRGNQYYSIMFDETTDMSHTSQMSLSLRYVCKGIVREDFVQFLDVHRQHQALSESYGEISDHTDAEPSITGQALGNIVINAVKSMNLDLLNCVGIGTDGCSVMTSQVRGAVSVIQSGATNAVRCPCFNHALNLSLGKSASVQSVRNAVGIVKEVVSFFTASAKRNFVLKNTVKGQLTRMCETRWIERHDSMIQFTSDLPKIIDALNIVSKWHERDSASKARGLMSAVCDCEFILAMFCVTDVLSLTLPLSTVLQSLNMDLPSALASVQDILSILQTRRTDKSHFSAVYAAAEAMMVELEISVTTPRRVKQQQNRPNPPASSPDEYYWRALYIPLLDCIIVDMQSRFSSDTICILHELSNIIPAKVVTLNNSQVLPVAGHLLRKYGNLLSLPSSHAGELQLSAEIALWRSKWMREVEPCTLPATASDAFQACDKEMYPATSSLLQLLLTLPVSVATAERSFSTLRRLKTWLRSRMTEQRLTGLALMNIHREQSISVDAVIDRYANSKARHLDFVL
jgi:hypothetical protein